MKFSFKNIDLNGFDLEDGIWFLSNDVCRILGYTDVSHTIQDHTSPDDRKAVKYADWVKMTETESQNRRDRMLINESGLYCLIFGSHLEGAKEFKLWVTRDVLPSIRKHGGYVDRQEELAPADQKKVIQKIERLSKKVEELAVQNARVKERWHSVCSERTTLKEQRKTDRKLIKKLKSNLSILNKECDDQDRLYRKVIDELDSVMTENRALKYPQASVPAAVAKPVAFSYKVDREGWLII